MAWHPGRGLGLTSWPNYTPNRAFSHRGTRAGDGVGGRATLAERILSGAIPVDEALPIARQVAEVLMPRTAQGVGASYLGEGSLAGQERRDGKRRHAPKVERIILVMSMRFDARIQRGWAAAGRCRRRMWPAALAVLALLLVCPEARADVGVVLNDSVSHGVARITGAGHSGVYFSRICPASPVRLRLCAPGEEGSVMSTYDDFGEDQNYEWNVVPLSVYLYGVEDAGERPLFGSDRIKGALERQYLEEFLSSHCTGPACAGDRKGGWRAMVGATLERTVYVFAMATTVEQDQAFVEGFNQRPNEGRFNGFTRNCADFAREVINQYFPKAVRRNYLNDFGMSSPKGIARSFARYAKSNPDFHYQVMHFPQAPGTIRKSSGARAGTEQLFRSKKLLLPTLFFEAPAAGISAITYLFTGRFNPQRELERYPAAEAEAMTQGREEEPDGPNGWAGYREAFDGIVQEAAQAGVIDSRKSLKSVFKSLDQQGRPVRDEDGRMWLEIHKDGEVVRVGMNVETIVSEESDPALAYRVMLARVEQALKSPARARPATSEFSKDWALLQQARENLEVWQASTARK
jgi:hypothetical protein